MDYSAINISPIQHDGWGGQTAKYIKWLIKVCGPVNWYVSHHYKYLTMVSLSGNILLITYCLWTHRASLNIVLPGHLW